MLPGLAVEEDVVPAGDTSALGVAQTAADVVGVLDMAVRQQRVGGKEGTGQKEMNMLS